MRMQQEIDFTTLNWVKQELDETLKQARQALEAYVEDPADSSLMRFCATYLHQVQGTLRMVELYGAAMVVEEMERVAQALLDDQIRTKDDAYDVLMRGIVQLPDYLERLQSGHKDIPIVLLPLLNDLRACRGEKLLSEGVLFSPDLSLPLPAIAAGPERPLPDSEMKGVAARQRANYQIALVKWLRDQSSNVAVSGLINALDGLRSITWGEDARRLWWIAAGLLDGIRAGSVDANQAVKLLFGRVDREIKRLADGGEMAFRTNPPRDLTKNLLYYAAHAKSSEGRLGDLKRAFKLDTLLPSEKELEHARGSLGGRNRALLDTVSGAIKEDLMRVKDALDLYLRTANANPGDLANQLDTLDRVADTLGMLGLGVPRRVVVEQRDSLRKVVHGEKKAEEGTLLDVAGALLFVEASLDDNIERLGGGEETPQPENNQTAELPQTEVRKILEALMKEVQTNLTQAKQDIVAFIESGWQHERAEQIPRLLEEISGAMRMINLDQAGGYLDAIGRFIEVEVIERKRVPNADQVDRLADAVASIEYYLEATSAQRTGREKILDVTRESLEALGYWPLPDRQVAAEVPAPAPAPSAAAAIPAAAVAAPPAAMPTPAPTPAPVPAPSAPATPAAPVAAAPVPEPQVETKPALSLDFPSVSEPVPAPIPAPAPELAAPLAPVPVSAPAPVVAVQPPEPEPEPEPEFDYEWVEVEEEIIEEAPLVSGASFQAVPSNDIDEDIREVFLEEVQEELENLSRNLPDWKNNPNDFEKLKPIRRSFHTMKGSGRLVGALALGEFSWKIENMLNRVLDKTIQPGAAVIACLDHSVAALPALLAALRGEQGGGVDVPGIMAVADRLAAGEDAWLKKPEPIRRIEKKMVQIAKPRPKPAPKPVPVPAPAPEPAAVQPPEPVFEPSFDLPAVAAPEPAAIDLSPSEEPETIELAGLDIGDLSLDDASPTLNLDSDSDVGAEALTAMDLADGDEAIELADFDFSISPPATSAEPVSAETDPVTTENEFGFALDDSAAIELSTDDLGGIEFDLPSAGLSASPTAPETEPTAVAPVQSQPEPTVAVPAAVPEAVAPADLDGVDPMMLEILRAEVSGHLAVIREFLQDAEQQPGTPVSEGLLRAVHTMHGAIAMVDLPSVTPLLGPLEGYIKRLRGQDQAPSAEGLAVIAATADAVEASINGRASPVDLHELADALNGLRSVLPEPDSVLRVFNVSVDEDEEHRSQEQASATAVTAPGSSFSPESGIDFESPVLETAASLDAPAEASTAPANEFGFDLPDFGLVESIGQSDAALNAPALTEQIPDDPQPATTAPALFDTKADIGFELPDWASEEISLEAPAESPSDTALAAPLQAPQPATPEEEISFADLVDFDLADPTPVQPEEAASSLDAGQEWLSAESLFLDAETDASPAPASSLQPAADLGEPQFDFAAELDSLDAGATAEPESTILAEPSAAADAPSLAWLSPAAEASAQAAAEASASFDEQGVQYVPIADDSHPDGPLELPDMDEDLLEIFVQEGSDILDASDTMMARLRETPDEREIVVGLQRELHTLKGGARMAGLSPIGDLSHAMESLFEMVADGRRQVDRVSLESLERGFDRLHSMVQRVSRRQAIAQPEHAIARFEAIVAGEIIPTLAPAPSKAAVPAVATPVPSAEVAPTVEASEAQEAAAPTPAPTPQTPRREQKTALDEAEEAGRAPQEVIRVRSDLLDALVNFAGEVSIYRSRLEQQMGTFRFNLQELDQTVLRVREQLRKLEIETEAQIIARYQREAEATDAEFDPLELDRFSTLQQLSRALAESVSDLQSLQNALDDLTRQAETLLLQQARVSSELQEGLMRTRMVPFDSVVPRLRRLMRQTSGELGKRAQLRVEGAQGEMDRNVLDRMTAPLEHMLRNALAHGLETPADRSKVGKNEEGTVTINISREATEVVIRVTDDGRGMDRDAIRRKAIERGMLKPDAHLSDRDLFGFVLETGFSTAESVSKIAGRGVGMDVVASEIKQLGGTLSIDSERGRGTQFIIRLPFTLAVTQAILVRLGEHLYAVPMSSVQGVVRIRREDLDERLKSPTPTYSYGGDDYLIYEMGDLLGTPVHRASDDVQLPLLMVKSGDQRAAVRVDAVLGSREVVVKSVGPQVSSIAGIFGATIMGDGSVVMILDMAPLVRRVAALRQTALAEDAIPEIAVPVAPERRQPLVMVVDDSITMRKVTTRVLERNDMEVVTAKDGLDAVEKLQDRVPDIVLLDIEMPRMDGYELATYMRNDPRLKTVPIIMITSRTGEKHRQRAFEIGVDRYLGKPYQEADLLRNVEETLRLSRAVH